MAFIFLPHGSACLQCKHSENLGFARPQRLQFQPEFESEAVCVQQRCAEIQLDLNIFEEYFGVV